MRRPVPLVVLVVLAACGGEEFRSDEVRAEVEALGAETWTVPFDEVVELVRDTCMGDDAVFGIVSAQSRIDGTPFDRLYRIGCPWRY